MCIGAPSIPAAPATPAVPPVPELPDQGATGVSTDPRTMAVAASGDSGTNLTGPQGLTTPPSTTAKSLLGS